MIIDSKKFNLKKFASSFAGQQRAGYMHFLKVQHSTQTAYSIFKKVKKPVFFWGGAEGGNDYVVKQKNFYFEISCFT